MSQKKYVIKQIDIKNNYLISYRGRNTDHNSKVRYSKLYYNNVNIVEEFLIGQDGIDIINDLFFKMEVNLIHGKNLNNADKYYSILELDNEKVNEYPWPVFANRFGYYEKYGITLAQVKGLIAKEKKGN